MNNFSLKFNTYYRLRWIEYFILFLVLFLSFYFGMSTYAIENINEGLYAEIPREMLQIGNYIIPNLNFVPYIEKPPLFYWLIALSYKLFGVSEWSARVVPATAAALVCISFVYFGNLLRRNREGWLTAIILATSIGFIAIGRVLIFDMVLTFFFTAALLSFYIWHKKSDIKYLRFFYIFTGLAFLTKGMLAIVLLPSIAILFTLSMPLPFRRLLQFFDPISLLLFTAIVVPWHYLAMKQQAGFAWDYFINEQVFRFLNKRIPHDYHTGPIYFYLPKIALYLFPWSLLSLLLFKKDKSVEKSLYRFLWLWFIIPLTFFSLSKAKAEHYMVIGMPPLAMLLALKINEVFNRPYKKMLIYFFMFLGIFEITAFGLLYSATVQNKIAPYLPEFFRLNYDFALPLLYLLIAVTVTSIIGLLLCLKYSRKPLLHFISIICLVLFLIIFYVLDKQKIEYQHSEASLAHYIVQHDPSRPVYLFKDYEKISSIVFYLKKRLMLIDSMSQDLYYGMHKPVANGWFLSLNNFVKAREEAHYVIARKDRFMEFIHSVAPHEYCIVAQSGSSVLLSNKMEDCGSH